MNKITTPILKDPFRWPKADNKRPGGQTVPKILSRRPCLDGPEKSFTETFRCFDH